MQLVWGGLVVLTIFYDESSSFPCVVGVVGYDGANGSPLVVVFMFCKS